MKTAGSRLGYFLGMKSGSRDATPPLRYVKHHQLADDVTAADGDGSTSSKPLSVASRCPAIRPPLIDTAAATSVAVYRWPGLSLDTAAATSAAVYGRPGLSLDTTATTSAAVYGRPGLSLDTTATTSAAVYRWPGLSRQGRPGPSYSWHVFLRF